MDINFKINSNSKTNSGQSLDITESMIKNIVHSFYAKVENDPLIGPIFKDKLGNDWSHHLAQMCDFWSGVALSTGRYKGQPMLKHVNLPGIEKEHFIRWLSLFEENAYSLYSEEIAEFFVNKAKKIADSFMHGIAFYRGNLNL